ncbi:MAG TPA: AsmA family protein [Methyloradius sp.]
MTQLADKQTSTAKSGRISVLLSVLIIAAIFTACEIAGWPFLRAPGEKILSNKLERTVRLDMPFKLHFFGGIRLDVGGLYIAAPEGFDTAYLLDSKNVALQLRYRDLIRFKPDKAFRIESLRVDSIDAQLLRHADGHATWQFKKDDSSSTPIPIIESLVVKNGRARFDDPITYSDLNMSFNTDEGSNDRRPTSHIDVNGKFRQKSLKGKISTDGFLPIATQDATSPAITTTLWLDYGGIHADFKGAASDLFGKQDIKGMLNIKGASLGILGDLIDTPLPTTDPFKLSGYIEKDDVVWLISVASATVGRSSLSGDFRYDPRPAKPVLSGSLKGSQFYLADLAPAFGTRNEDGSKSKNRTDRAIPDRPIDLPSLNKVDAQIKVDLTYVELGNAFNHPISPFKADLGIDNGKLTLSIIDARTADGSLSGLISVDAHAADTAPDNKPVVDNIPKWNIDLAWKNINLEQWLKVSEQRKENAKSQGKKTPPPAYVTGQLNGKTNLSGTGNSTAQLLGSLDGDIAMVIQNGSISHLIIEVLGLDIAQGLGMLLKGDESLPMQCAVIDLKATKGLVEPTIAMIDTPVTLVLIDGNLSLAKESLDLKLTAKPKNMSPLTARSPIHVTGTFSDPKASPEGGPIAARILGGLALAIINPLTAILPFIDTGDASAESPCKQSLTNLKKS